MCTGLACAAACCDIASLGHLGGAAYAALFGVGVACCLENTYNDEMREADRRHTCDSEARLRRIETTVKLCANETCPRFAHPLPEFGGYCCKRCPLDGEHGRCCLADVPSPPGPISMGDTAGPPIVWLHGKGGSPADRAWLLGGLPWHRYHVLDIAGSAEPWGLRGCHSWFEYAGQWAAHGAGHDLAKCVTRVLHKVHKLVIPTGPVQRVSPRR